MDLQLSFTKFWRIINLILYKVLQKNSYSRTPKDLTKPVQYFAKINRENSKIIDIKIENIGLAIRAQVNWSSKEK